MYNRAVLLAAMLFTASTIYAAEQRPYKHDLFAGGSLDVEESESPGAFFGYQLTHPHGCFGALFAVEWINGYTEDIIVPGRGHGHGDEKDAHPHDDVDGLALTPPKVEDQWRVMVGMKWRLR